MSEEGSIVQYSHRVWGTYETSLSDDFPAQNDLKEACFFLPLVFSVDSEYAIWKVQENQAGLKLDGTH
jgi:hypothetical protein